MLPGLVGAALSPMFFDAPGSMNNPAAWANALIIVSFPCLCILSIIVTWIAWFTYKRRPTPPKRYMQIVAALLPVIPVAYVAGALLIGMGQLIVTHQPMGLHTTIIHNVSGPQTRHPSGQHIHHH